LNAKKGKEIKKRFGKLNSDLTFYVIRRSPPGSGFFSNYFFVFAHFKEAMDRGFIPVVDMENYLTNYHDLNLKRINAWETYFKKVSLFELKEVYKSKNVILSDWSIMPNKIDLDSIFEYNRDYIRNLNNYLAEYLTLNDRIKLIVENSLKSLIPSDKKVLGVSSRGTDYRLVEGDGIHDFQASKELLLNKVIELFDESNFDYIFLATEEQEVLDYFYKHLKSKLLFLKRDRITSFKTYGVPETFHANSPDGVFKTTIDYVSEIFILSKCNHLICGKNNGSTTAVIWNNARYDGITLI
jgi:hypothetical protein